MSTYVSTRGDLVSDETLPNLKRSLEYLAEGVSRTVYALSETEVLKVCHNPRSFAGNNRSEWDAYLSIAEEDRGYFATCHAIAADGSWMVAERIEGTAYDLGSHHGDPESHDCAMAVADDYGIGDLHDQNWGWRTDGTAVIIDYAFNDKCDGGSDGWDSDQCGCDDCRAMACGCGSCRCDDCKPEGCDCGSWEGCNEQWCSRCLQGVARQRAIRSTFGFVPRFGSAVCDQCDTRKVPPRREIRGQGAMIGPRFTFGGPAARLIEDVLTGAAQVAWHAF